ncbi:MULTISPECIES: hypothetical protein [Lysobacter]|jgi:hypothetical protein|nr:MULTISPECIES: hypothetical protein [Lysobacter]ALN94208.1 hypothetical protein LG3211_5276 [Lysobacter gummosus]UJB19126.1 hypothetical protein L1A79_22900 [Lysobacter capsici]UJQ27149.1 hypothetical protein L2D09_16985 [Lysobacter gummosus]
MRLRLQGAMDAEARRRITEAVLRADLGSRINFERDAEHDAQIVRVENWLTVAQTVEAITRNGYAVAAIVDASNEVPAI